MPEFPEVLKSRYRIDSEPLGPGRLSRVYRMTCRRSGRKLALKTTPSISSARREERALKRVHELCPERFPRLYDTYVAGGSGYLLMEYIRRNPLDQRIEDLPIGRFTHRLIRSLLQAVACIHGADFLHADLQPGNLLVATSHTRAPVVKLVDFSSAVELERGIYRGVSPGGTWEFMPPEQFDMRVTLDERADVYSAGAVVAYILNHKIPFQPTGTFADVAVYRKECLLLHQERRFQRPHSSYWNSILDRALQPDPNRRFPNIQEFLDAL